MREQRITGLVTRFRKDPAFKILHFSSFSDATAQSPAIWNGIAAGRWPLDWSQSATRDELKDRPGQQSPPET
jgi:hypothetical protein